MKYSPFINDFLFSNNGPYSNDLINEPRIFRFYGVNVDVLDGNVNELDVDNVSSFWALAQGRKGDWRGMEPHLFS